MAALFISVYDILEGNYHHMALSVPARNLIFQIKSTKDHQGNVDSYYYNHRDDTQPENSRTHLIDIQVGSFLEDHEIETLSEVCAAHATSGDSESWCCQDWVMEVLEELVEEGIISSGDLTDAKEQVANYIGPQI